MTFVDGTSIITEVISPIECFVEYPRIDFGEPKRRKRLTRCDVWLSNLVGEVDLTVYWRPDNNQKWTLWDETSHCAIMQDAATATPHVWKNLLPEQRPLVKTFSIPDTFDDVTTYALATGFGFQIRLAWTGSVKTERVAIWAQAVDSTDYVEREGQEPTCIANDVTGNELRYEIPLGKTALPASEGDKFIDVSQIMSTGTYLGPGGIRTFTVYGITKDLTGNYELSDQLNYFTIRDVNGEWQWGSYTDDTFWNTGRTTYDFKAFLDTYVWGAIFYGFWVKIGQECSSFPAGLHGFDFNLNTPRYCNKNYADGSWILYDTDDTTPITDGRAVVLFPELFSAAFSLQLTYSP